MAERIIHLSVTKLFGGDHNHPAIPRFIEEFSSILHTGDGKKPVMLEKLGIGPDFPVRLLVGIPAKSMTREQRLIAESCCAMLLGRQAGDHAGLWSYGTGWRPTNPSRIAAPIRDSQLDTEWMFSLGISKSIWTNDILLAPSAFQSGNKRLPSTMIRYLFAMVAFGFSNPHQFFTGTTQSQTAKESMV